MSELKPLTEAETTELLDWVSACQSSYLIDSTPGHRFGGLGSNLQENRESLVEYVNELIAARAQPAQAGQVLSDAEIDALYAKSDLDADPGSDYGCGFYSGARWAEQAVLAKMGVAVPSDVVRDADLALDLLSKLFNAYENGLACYEEPDEQAGYVGNAVELDADTFHACADLLNRRRPIAAIAQQKGGV